LKRRGLRHNGGVVLVRVVLPAAIFVAGLLLVVLRGADDIGLQVGGLLMGSGIAVWLTAYLLRLGNESQSDRDREEAAREHFTRHGHWPGEGPRS
jgi:hypothetical protein